MNKTHTEVLVGIDAGSTHLKTAIYSTAGDLLSIRHCKVSLYHSSPGFSEFRPSEIFEQLCQNLKEQLTASLCPVAVGISSFGESVVAIDKNGTPLDDMIAWFDMRGESLIQKFAEEATPFCLFSSTGQHPSGKFTLAKLLWLHKNKPELLEKTYCFLFMQDYLAYRLCGNLTTDFSLASRSMLFHIQKMCWDSNTLNLCGLSASQLPKVIPTGTASGLLTVNAATLTGLPAGIPVVLAGHDHASASIAAGIDTDDQILDSLGTSETSVISGNLFLPKKLYTHNICAYPHYQGNLRYITSIQGCGASIDWMANLFFQEQAFQKFFFCAQKASLHYQTLPITLPFLRGLMEAPSVLGHISNLNTSHTKDDLCYSLLEGLCFEYKRRILDMQNCIPSKIHTVRAVGRLSKNPEFMQLKANILHMPVEILNQAEAVSLGAAILAGKYTGHIQSWTPKIESTYIPQTKNKLYEARFQKYLNLLQNLL